MNPTFAFSLRPELEKLCEEYNKTAETKLSPVDFIPTRSKELDVGYDVRCADLNGHVVKPGAYVKIDLGFRMFAPAGWWLFLPPRSSTFTKLKLHSLYGTIDPNYENYMAFAAQYLPDVNDMTKADVKINFGDRVAQVIPMERHSMERLVWSPEEYEKQVIERGWSRGISGFGGSGQK